MQPTNHEPSSLTVVRDGVSRTMTLNLPTQRMLRWAIRRIYNRMGDGKKQSPHLAKTLLDIQLMFMPLFTASKHGGAMRIEDPNAVTLLVGVLRTRVINGDVATRIADFLEGK
jgi:hypothetical protein